MINVTKTFLPPFEEYTAVLKRAWDKAWITNKGELVLELEQKLKEYLGAKHVLFCSNGTIALQIAIKALHITKEVITTPFSYVATVNSILWENCTPVFADINSNDFCIDSAKIEAAITPETQAILATHVYGTACDIDAIQKIADRYSLKIIYDGAHAFATKYKGQSIFNYGDISTCSFHATKLFHTAEGGCIVTNDDAIAEKVILYRQFGHLDEDYYSIGINGKNSELHAALGICNLNYIDVIIKKRKEQWLYYKQLLHDKPYQLLNVPGYVEFNYSYFPLVFSSEVALLKALQTLKKNEVIPRRYFHPSLNTLPYLAYQPAPVSESISKRIICLPLFLELTLQQQEMIINTILESQNETA